MGGKFSLQLGHPVLLFLVALLASWLFSAFAW